MLTRFAMKHCFSLLLWLAKGSTEVKTIARRSPCFRQARSVVVGNEATRHAGAKQRERETRTGKESMLVSTREEGAVRDYQRSSSELT